ncbi:hypothetical protein [Streptantibioticus parmotrematis]|uniref:hypothetical protein n=1 Tax=Streptantibioticus parmotrematis TaxID=2873249 RepID=UPI00207BF75D|nr:hypothetical protein [Streptantibioticus parmotrematis]
MDWFVFGAGGLGVRTRLSLAGTSINDAHLVTHALGSKPVGSPDAEMSDILVTGTGTWVDAQGEQHQEQRLVELTVSPASIGLSAEGGRLPRHLG